MGEIVDIDELRPHAMIIGPKREPHVISIEAIKRMADGRNKLINKGQEEIDIDLIQGLIADWLFLSKYNHE